MKISNLNRIELVNINGGTKKSYSLGHNVGTHIRETISSVGSFLGGIVDMISPFA